MTTYVTTYVTTHLAEAVCIFMVSGDLKRNRFRILLIENNENADSFSEMSCQLGCQLSCQLVVN